MRSMIKLNSHVKLVIPTGIDIINPKILISLSSELGTIDSRILCAIFSEFDYPIVTTKLAFCGQSPLE